MDAAVNASHSAEQRHFRLLCLVTGLLLVLMLIIFSSSLGFHARRFVSDIGLLAGGVLTAWSCGLRWRSTTGRKRRSWLFFALAGAMAAIGNGWVLYTHIAGLSDRASNYGDVGFILALLMGIIALLSFPSIKRRGTDLARILFDGIVIGGSLLSIAGVTIFPQLLNQTAGSPSSRNTSLVLCVVDIVVATLAAMLVVRGDRADRTVLLLLAAGLISYAISDLARAELTARAGFNFGGPVDVGWIAGYALFALAARHRSGSPTFVDNAPAAATPPLVSSSITFGLFLLAALIRVWRLPITGSSVLLSGLWVVVLVCVTTRQALLIVDNEALRRDLEHRVDERTSELQDLTRTSETMLDSVGDGIYGVDHRGYITFVNPSAASMLGYPTQDLIGAQAHDLFHCDQLDGTPFPYDTCYIAEAIRLGTTTTSEEDVYRRHDQLSIPVEVTASPLGSSRDAQGAVVVFRDMTQRREVDRLKSEFVSVVSHELRTPLTSIRGSLGLLSAGALGELTPAATRMVKIALDSSERLTRLINDILDIERIESGTMPMQMEQHQASALIEAAVNQVQTLANEGSVRLSANVARGLVWADSDRVVQTLVNLLGNAIKFSDVGSVVDIQAAPQKDGMIMFSVSDQGRGIPAEKLDSVFRRFEQVDSSDAREKGGSGLGLAISRSIVERHGGEIWVESTVGQGSKFSFTVPAAPALVTGGDESDGPTVLVCDDDADFVEVLCTVLGRRGYRALGVTSAEHAIKIAAEQLPDAVLVDLMMNGKSGADVVSALRQNSDTKNIPLVIVSGLDPTNDLRLAGQTDDWLVKPVDEDQLIHTLTVSIADHEIKGRVLMVEDDEAVATVVRTLLRRRGLNVDHARTQEEALRLAREIQPEVLILDLQLPDGNGHELVEAMRADDRLSKLPVVVYSASDIPADQRDDLRLGTTVFLTKGRESPQSLEQRVIQLVDQATSLKPPVQVAVPDAVVA